MLQKNILAILLTLILAFAPSAYAGRAELTTYFPIPYGLYTNLKSTGTAYFATNAGENVAIGMDIASLNRNGKLDVAGPIHSSDTSTGFFLGGGGSLDNWVRLMSVIGATYHDLAVGSFYACNSTDPPTADPTLRYDLAEVTPVKEEDQLSQGEAVVTDKDKGSRVTRSTKPYDTAVLGIVSSYEQAAMVIGGNVAPENAGKTKDKLPLALVGRVKAKVSAENGPIKPGDLLTTSSTPGHLMKCDDRTKCLGAVVGKAFEPWEKDTGMIEILATLQ